MFHIDIKTCRECGGAVRVVARIEDPVIIKKIRTHLEQIENLKFGVPHG